MAKILVDGVSDGLRQSEAVARFSDFHGRTHFIRVEKDFLIQDQGRCWLSVGVVHVDPKTKAVLIELPHEAETGANRIWVRGDRLDEPIEAFA